MKPKSKIKTIGLVAVTIVTIVLAIVAVVTALKLKQFATVPIAPNAPASKPKPAFNTPTNAACQTTFTVEATGAAAVTCESKTVYKGTTKPTATDTVSVGDILTYKVKLTSTD